MTTDPLLPAVLAAPDDDLPRLVYADWLDERGDAALAAFVRGQIELARLPPWHPVAARLVRENRDLPTGRAFLGRLPPVGDGRAMNWDESHAYRRGFGWGLRVTFLPALTAAGASLFAAAPVGRLALPTATLADWQALARRPWLTRVRVLHFPGLRTPIEPLAVLGESEFATGVREVEFAGGSRPAVPAVLARLLASPMGPLLTAIRFGNGAGGPDFLAALAGAEATRLTHFAYPNAGLTAGFLRRLLAPPLFRKLASLGLRANPLGDRGARALAAARNLGNLEDLDARDCGFGPVAVAELAAAKRWEALRRIDLGGNPLGPHGVAAAATGFPGLHALRLAHTGADDRAAAGLTRAAFAPHLVELDLRRNPITDAGKAMLRATFGDRVLLD